MRQSTPHHFNLLRLATAVFSLLVCLMDAQAEDTSPIVNLSGAIRGDYFQSTRSLDDRRDIFGGTAQMKGDVRPSESSKIVFEARGSNTDISHSGHSDSQIVEGYFAITKERWDWRFGKQIIAWGRADGINPTDVISPRDYTVLLPFDEDQRVGTWAATASYAWDTEVNISAILKTEFSHSTIPLASTAPNSYVFVKPEDHAPQIGLRINRAGGDVDWSVSLFRGHSLLPHAGPQQPFSGVPLQLTYPVVTMLGMDMATNFSNFGTRLELAYFHPDHQGRADQPSMRRNLYLVAGVDRTFFHSLNFNVQLFTRRTWDIPSDNIAPQYSAAELFNQAVFMQQRDQISGFTMRIANTWINDLLTAEVFVQHYFYAGDTFVQPMVTYAFTDKMRGSLGGQYFAGHGAQLGPLRKNNGLFSEVRYSF